MKKAVLLQALASLLMLSPILFLNRLYFLGNTDSLFYTTILRLVSGHLLAGDLRPLWLPEANGGAGTPAMLFYSPLAYYLNAVVTAPFMLFLSDTTGIVRLGIGMFFAQWAGGVAAYYWLRKMVSGKNALIASLFFTMFPYKFVYIFMHLNLAQIWALMFLPLMMGAAYDIAAGRNKAWLWYTVWLALLTLTHPRTVIAFGALPVLYAVVFAGIPRWKIGLRLLAAHLLAFALAAFYLLPALLNIGMVKSELANVGRMYYGANLSHIDVHLNFHYLFLVMLMLGLLSRLPAFRHSRHGRETWFYIAAMGMVAFLCLRLSRPLWDVMPLLQMLQFPAARLHAPALIAATAMVAYYFEHRRAVASSRMLYSAASVVIPAVVAAGWILVRAHNTYSMQEHLKWPYLESLSAVNPIYPPEYLTRWQKDDASTIESIKALSEMKFADTLQGQGKVGGRMKDARTVVLKTRSRQDMIVRVRQIFLPQWQARGYNVTADDKGLIKLHVPRGRHTVILRLAKFPGESYGKLISLLAAALAGILLLRRTRPKPR